MNYPFKILLLFNNNTVT